MNDIIKAISELPIAEQLDIRNTLFPDEHAVFAGKDRVRVYKVSDMEAWREKEGISFHTHLDEDGDLFSVTYMMDGVESPYSFDSERKVLNFLFEGL